MSWMRGLDQKLKSIMRISIVPPLKNNK
jgi:hypothetical protein